MCGLWCATIFRRNNTIIFTNIKTKNELCEFLDAHPYWRKNAIAFTKRYIAEGLRDRAITRDLDWGIDVPKRGYEDKKIYIWAENVLGYLSATFVLCEERGIDFKEAYGTESRHYYVHGKDNIPFHTIILPSLLLAHGDGLHLPDNIISSEYMTLEGRKISTSQNWAVWAKDLAEEYNPDAIRYFFIANGPENETLISLGENSKSKTTQSWLALGETWSTVHLPLLLSFLIVKLRLQLLMLILKSEYGCCTNPLEQK